MVFFDEHTSFEKGEKSWDEKAETLKSSHPLKLLKTLPKMPGVTKNTQRFLKVKSLKYLIKEDEKKLFPRFFFKHPFKYGIRLLRSYLKKKPFQRENDFFFYGVKDRKAFEKELKKSKAKLLIGFSYCHKPFECPSGRFTDACIRDPKNSICRQCFIGKCANVVPKKAAQLVFIPTIHYIGEKMFEMVQENPKEKVLFMITACELTLKMFADWGNMINAQGIGIRLDGRICNTMKAFELSEKGIKPGLTVVLDQTQQQVLELLRLRRETFSS